MVLVDLDEGAVVATGRSAHRVTGTGGVRETDPVEWWAALQIALAGTDRTRDIAAISVAGQQHGLVVLDASGNPLRPAMLWNDTRSAPDAVMLRDRLGGAEWWAENVGVVPVASFTASKWAWLLRTEAGTADAVRSVLLPHDFLNLELIGRAVTDRGDASGTAWWSSATGSYAGEVLDELRLDPRLLPEVGTPAGAIGEVTVPAAEATGLRAGIPVAVGTGDNMAAALGLGLQPGVPVISLGTSGTAYAVSTCRTVDATGAVAGFADATELFLPLAATLNCTLAVDRVASWLGLDREAAAGSTDVVVLPYLDGERTPDLPQASGSIQGLRHETTAGEILLGAYEGAAASLLDAIGEVAVHGSGLTADAPLILIGGGAGGATWKRVIGRMSGRRLLIPYRTEPVALGVAAQAAAVLTGEGVGNVAQRWGGGAGDVIDPIPVDEEAFTRIREARRSRYGI